MSGLKGEVLYRVKKQGHIVLKVVDDFTTCDHNAYAPLCDRCAASIIQLKNPEPVQANAGIQFYVNLYLLSMGVPLIETHYNRAVELFFQMNDYLYQNDVVALVKDWLLT